MPTISSFYGIYIVMYFSEKHGPHFHAKYGEYTAQFSVTNGEILGGSLPPRIVRLTREWWKLHRAELLANWELARNRHKLNQIEGLK